MTREGGAWINAHSGCGGRAVAASEADVDLRLRRAEEGPVVLGLDVGGIGQVAEALDGLRDSLGIRMAEGVAEKLSLGNTFGIRKAEGASRAIGQLRGLGNAVGNTAGVVRGLARLLPVMDEMVAAREGGEEMTDERIGEVAMLGLELYDGLRWRPFNFDLPEDPYHRALRLKENVGCFATLGILGLTLLSGIVAINAKDINVLAYGEMLGALLGGAGYVAHRKSGKMIDQRARSTAVTMFRKRGDEIWEKVSDYAERARSVVDFIGGFEKPRETFQNELYGLFHPIERALDKDYCDQFDGSNEKQVADWLRDRFIEHLQNGLNGLLFLSKWPEYDKYPFIQGLLRRFGLKTGQIDLIGYREYIKAFAGPIYGGLVDLTGANGREGVDVRRTRAERTTRLWVQYPFLFPGQTEAEENLGLRGSWIGNELSRVIGSLGDLIPTNGQLLREQFERIVRAGKGAKSET